MSTRKTVPIESSLARAVPLPDGHMMVDGVEHATVVIGKSWPFAKACLEVMKEEDGRDRSHWLERKAILVPVRVIALARSRLGARDAGGAEKVTL